MSLVCFPFKHEKVSTVLRNVTIAANHPGVSMVLLVGATENDCYRDVAQGVSDIESQLRAPVRLLIQRRLGNTLRGGKGDGMNTAMLYFLSAHTLPENNGRLDSEIPLQRLHFYDADIESFDDLWITKAEEGSALGYDVVRHYFPRSSTDAQITWQVTKVGFALLWSRSTLPWIQQPLGGELCFARHVVETLVADKRVIAQSNWGIDTLYTWVCAEHGFSLLEVYVPQGKMHALYGGLRDLESMVCECFDAIQSLKHETIPTDPSIHRIDPPAAVPDSITSKIGYDVQKSLKLLAEGWSKRQYELLKLFGDRVQEGMRAATDWPEYIFMDEDTWIAAYEVFLKHFNLNDPDWRALLFRMWVVRVINYTLRHVLRGYSSALQANTNMITKLHMKRSLEVEALAGSASSISSGAPSSPPGEWEIKSKTPTSPVLPTAFCYNS